MTLLCNFLFGISILSFVWCLSGIFLYATRVVKDKFTDCLWTPPVVVIINSIPRSLWLMITIAAIKVWVTIVEFSLWFCMSRLCVNAQTNYQQNERQTENL